MKSSPVDALAREQCTPHQLYGLKRMGLAEGTFSGILVPSVRLVAWMVADDFRALEAEAFSRSTKLDAGELGQKRGRWWDESTWYAAGVAAHLAENLKWWSLTKDEKDAVREFERGTRDDAAARKRLDAAFPFDPAFIEGKPRGLPATSRQVKGLGDVFSTIRRKELAVAYLEGLAALPYVGEDCSLALGSLAERAAAEALSGDSRGWGPMMRDAAAFVDGEVARRVESEAMRRI